MNDKESEEIIKTYLPVALQEYFAKNRKVFDNNMEKFEETENELSKTEVTDEQKAIIQYIINLAKEQYRSMSDQLENNEMLYTFSFILRKKIEDLTETLEKQGIKLDGLLRYEKGLKYVDDYIKHSSENKES